jgi:hypothetical protein
MLAPYDLYLNVLAMRPTNHHCHHGAYATAALRPSGGDWRVRTWVRAIPTAMLTFCRPGPAAASRTLPAVPVQLRT